MNGVEFHLQSLALTMVFVSAVAFLCLAPAIFRFPEEFRPGLRAWIIGTALVTATDVVFFTGVELAYLDTTLIALAALGITELMHGLRLLNDQTAGRPAWPYIVVLAASVLSAIYPSYPMTAFVTSVAFGLLYLSAARSAVLIRLGGPSVGRAVLVAVFAIIGIVMLSRIVLFLTVGGSGASPGFTTLPRAMMFVVASAGPFAGSLAFVLTCGEKLGHQLIHLSLTDSLTDIPNRRAFLESMERALSAGTRHSTPVAVMVADIDHFKRINDECGHPAGDAALVEVARRIAAAVRSEDMVGRLGGEEFGIIQSDAELDLAAAAAERIRESVASSPVSVAGTDFKLTVSVGVTVTSEQPENASQLLLRADRLLYTAKRLGRDQIVTG
ncbi:MAG: GGDEF domain-containing protein [bacterium]|nr:GGDEF domain-containing protein [bacterium]